MATSGDTIVAVGTSGDEIYGPPVRGAGLPPRAGSGRTSSPMTAAQWPP